MGQRATLWLGLVLSALAIMGLIAFSITVTSPRLQTPALDTANVTYCDVTSCDLSNPLGLKIRDITLSENEFETTILIEFVNEQRWQGEREVWIQFRTKKGTLIEMAKGEMFLNDKTAELELSFTGSISELNNLNWFLGF